MNRSQRFRLRSSSAPRLSPPAPTRPGSITAPERPATLTPQPGRYFQVDTRDPQWGAQWDPEIVAEYAYPDEGTGDLAWVHGARRIQSHPANASARLRPPRRAAESLFFPDGIIDYGAPYQLILIPPPAWLPYVPPEPCVPSGAGWLCPDVAPRPLTTRARRRAWRRGRR
jgi:hypothetical protein